MIEEDTHEKYLRKKSSSNWQRISKGEFGGERNEKFGLLFTFNWLLFVIIPRLKSKVELFRWMDGRARDVPVKWNEDISLIFFLL